MFVMWVRNSPTRQGAHYTFGMPFVEFQVDGQQPPTFRMRKTLAEIGTRVNERQKHRQLAN